MATRDFKEQRLSKKPRFIHSSSNISKAQISGLMKGAVMRCVDTACDIDALYTTIVHTYGAGLPEKKFSPSGAQFVAALPYFTRNLFKINESIGKIC